MATVTYNLRVATWNIHEGLPVGGQHFDMAVQDELVSLISREQIDILCLQEVDFDRRGRSRILDVIRRRSGLRFAVKSILSESSFFPAKCAGVAIASRFPLGKSLERRLKNPGLVGQLDGNDIESHDKGMVSAVVSVADGIVFTATSLHAFPFHLFGHRASDRAFTPIWTDLASELSSLAAYPLIVCGDFNTGERDLVLRMASVSLSRAIGNVPTYKDRPYDDILVSADFCARSSWTVENFSDHRLCLANLSLEMGQQNERESARASAIT